MAKVAVDVVGGDFAPGEMVAGTAGAINARPGIRVLLVGQEQTVASELGRYTHNKGQIQVVGTTEVIVTEGPPANVIKKKKDSSIVVGMNLVKRGEANAFVSAGGSGAILTGGQVIVGRIKGAERPPLTPLIPAEKGVLLLIDYGINVGARASHLVQFTQMGSIYMEHMMGIRDPRIAIVNTGAEEEKGSTLIKETFPLLKEYEGINFIGSIEAREIPHDAVGVIVYEASMGDVILKFYEGVGAILIDMVKGGMMPTLRSEIGALFVKPALKQALKAFGGSQYGRAPPLGLNNLVVKIHGSSKRAGVRNSIIQHVASKEQEINEKIRESLGAEDTE